MQLTKGLQAIAYLTEHRSSLEVKEKRRSRRFLGKYLIPRSLQQVVRIAIKSKEVTRHQNRHPGEVKEEPQGRKRDSPGLLESKRHEVQRERYTERVNLVLCRKGNFVMCSYGFQNKA